MNEEISNSSNQLISNQQPSQTAPSSPFKAILFELFFVGIVFILVFGALNYFNIFRLSEIFPNQLGFLPHKTYQQSQQYNNTTTVSTTAPAVIVPTEQSAIKVLTRVLPNILVPSLVPNPFQIVVKSDKQLKQILNESWYINQSTVSATLFTLPNGRDIASLNLYITKEENASPSPELAKTATSQVFVLTPKGTWGCSLTNNQIAYCENFWEEENGVRKGIAMEVPILVPGRKPLSFYLFCEHHKESVGLYAWKSCRSEFAKTGVQ